MESVILSADYSELPIRKSAHYHNCHELLYITDGWVKIELEKEIYQAKAGNLVIFSRLEQHSILTCSENYKRYVVQIASDIPSDDIRTYQIFSVLFNRPEKFRNILSLSSCRSEAEQLFIRITEEKSKGDALSDSMLNLLMQELLILVCRQSPMSFSEYLSCDIQAIRSIQTYLDREYHNDISLKSLSEDYGMSVSYLSHKFKSLTGKSVMDYLQCSRIAAAKEFLSVSDKKISEIIEMCGFSDASNFSRKFKEMTGLCPRDFRKQNRSAKAEDPPAFPHP